MLYSVKLATCIVLASLAFSDLLSRRLPTRAVGVVASGAHQGVAIAQDSQLCAHVIDLMFHFALAAVDVRRKCAGAQISRA